MMRRFSPPSVTAFWVLLTIFALTAGSGIFSVQARTPIFSASATRQMSLPVAMTGAWRMTAIREETNDPETFAPLTYDVWSLSPVESGVQLVNPESGASVTAPLTQARSNAAAFSRVVLTKRLPKEASSWLYVESPELTVVSGQLVGVTHTAWVRLENQQVIAVRYARYRLVGERL